MLPIKESLGWRNFSFDALIKVGHEVFIRAKNLIDKKILFAKEPRNALCMSSDQSTQVKPPGALIGENFFHHINARGLDRGRFFDTMFERFQMTLAFLG